MPLTSILALIVVGLVYWVLKAYVPLSAQMKTVLNVVLVLIAVGIVLWLINTYIPMAGSIKAILNIVVVIATCVGVLQALGLWDRLWSTVTNFRAPRVVRSHRIVRPPEQHT